MQKDCSYQTIFQSNLSSHTTRAHGLGREARFVCHLDDCEARFVSSSELRGHFGIRHGITAALLSCPENGCQFKSRDKTALNYHIDSKHTREILFECPQPGCSYASY